MIHVDDVHVLFDGAEVLRGIDLEVRDGETVALLGASGSGKTTLLRVLAGLERPARGRVVVRGEDVTSVPAHRRGIGLVFQQAVLFPHRDVAGNVAFGLAGQPAAQVERRVGELLDLVGLPGFQRRAVGTLSGGEAQRVALARALAPSPSILLLDEPLGALDGPLRDRLQDDLAALFSTRSLTVVHVTHDVTEAFALGDRVAVLHEGVVAQVGTPEELWRTPADVSVARFLGIRNVLVVDGRLVVVRPEAVTVAPGGPDRVVGRERRGPTIVLTVRRADGVVLESVTTALEAPAPGEAVRIAIDPTGTSDVGRAPMEDA
jgi:thiamine transport system ATP-binding protein